VNKAQSQPVSPTPDSLPSKQCASIRHAPAPRKHYWGG
jgi:hypothetical protein